ncbi:LysE/ArgO family amino acid transporter [Mobilicoccus pelagius]|uniref:Putative amino acid transporter n=1 Tax=Mobilicoccus pelagius NBRC 104925 TaxID=1089455 RepID=H5UQP6_9MICO|nr:LysE/ArgO family amino acid transporter [Mobilicoccus pelagius]GAB48054.1 putative amino acid transporter [Mobilicoccus pelagius NBRC 104925]
MSTALLGFLTGAALIVAIGAQNAYVLRQGLRREHVGVVIAICSSSDVVLIAVGVAGIGGVSGLHPLVLDALRWAGAAYLVWFGLRSLWSARHAGALEAAEPRGAGSVATTAIALTWLNPHVYLDTVLLLGSVANQHGPQGRWVFASGAMTASIAWFTSLGLGARALAPLLSHPRTWQALDVIVGLTMLTVAVLLVRG